MKPEYVFHGGISPHAHFFLNGQSEQKLFVKPARGGRKRERTILPSSNQFCSWFFSASLLNVFL